MSTRCAHYQVDKMPRYLDDLTKIEIHIAQENPLAAVQMWLHIDEQVDLLSDPNFPRRPGRVVSTFELVAHKNYIIVLTQDDAQCAVRVLRVLHAAQQYPS